MPEKVVWHQMRSVGLSLPAVFKVPSQHCKQSRSCMAAARHLEDDVVDEEVGGCRQGCANAGRNARGVLDQHAQLTEDGPTQHGPQEDIEDVPHKEDKADAPVQAAEGGRASLLLRYPAPDLPSI